MQARPLVRAAGRQLWAFIANPVPASPLVRGPSRHRGPLTVSFLERRFKMKHRTFVVSALAALSVIAGVPLRADNMASIAIAPATGAVTLTPRWNIGSGLGGFHHM